MCSVSELDADGPDTSGAGTEDTSINQKNVVISRDSIQDIERNLAIVIPCMNEDTTVLQALLRGVPHWCLVIFVSNSNQQNFEAECKLLLEFGRVTDRAVTVIHQGSSSFARAFQEAGMTNLLQTPKEGDLPRINNGKGEAMILGVIVAKLMKRKFVGFIDADNRVPGSVLEYCKVFAAGLHHALRHTSSTGKEQHAMVRIKWKSKPKVRDGELAFDELGRSSRVVNDWMNRLLKVLGGDTIPETMISTSNAGEHAMSIDLALKLRFATGYAVEPFQLIDVWEKFDDSNEPLSQVRILQVETCNPHIHDAAKGDEHIERMQVQGLSTIYHSDLTTSQLKNELGTYMKENLATFVGDNGEPEKPVTYNPLDSLDWNVFAKMLLESGKIG
jgi:mannosyl-3-phosphoglycerate synthase